MKQKKQHKTSVKHVLLKICHNYDVKRKLPLLFIAALFANRQK